MPFDRKAYDLERYRRRRAELVRLLGGRCVDCGKIDDLEFDHVDPATKELEISKSMFRRWDLLLAEVQKCVLRCAECHKTRSDAALNVERGGGLSGKKNCPCLDCRARKSEYMKQYKQNRRKPV